MPVAKVCRCLPVNYHESINPKQLLAEQIIRFYLSLLKVLRPGMRSNPVIALSLLVNRVICNEIFSILYPLNI